MLSILLSTDALNNALDLASMRSVLGSFCRVLRLQTEALNIFVDEQYFLNFKLVWLTLIKGFRILYKGRRSLQLLNLMTFN